MTRVVLRAVMLAVAAMAIGQSAVSQSTDRGSGNAFLPGCRVAAQSEQPSEKDFIPGLLCLATLSAIIAVSPAFKPELGFCYPENGSTGEAARIAVAYLEKNPSMVDKDFRVIAVFAMREAWPCKP